MIKALFSLLKKKKKFFFDGKKVKGKEGKKKGLYINNRGKKKLLITIFQ